MAAEHPILILLAGAALLLIVLVALPSLYVLFMMYVAVPLRDRGRPHSAEMPFIETDVTRMPRIVAEYFSRAARQLAPAGFTAVAHFRAPQHAPGSDGYVSVWLNERDGASVQVIGVWVDVANVPRSETLVVTFCTEFADGSAVVTSNTPHVSCFVHDPVCDSVRWPWNRNLTTLYRLHQFRVSRAAAAAGAAKTTFLPRREDVLEYMRKSDLKTLWRQADAGYYVFDGGSNVFRRTTKGAFLMTWKLLWPLRQRAERGNERKLRRELEAAGMPPPEAHRPQPPDEDGEAHLSYHRPVDDEAD